MANGPGRRRRLGGFAMIGAAVVLFGVLVISPRLGVHRPAPGDSGPAPCYTTRQLAIEGALTDCADPAQAHRSACSTAGSPGSYSYSGVMRGPRGKYILYVDLAGTYNGPQQYSLRPWRIDSLGVPEGVSKVALREYVSGDLWRSIAGNVTIAGDGESGRVSARLAQPGDIRSLSGDVQIDGHWQCG